MRVYEVETQFDTPAGSRRKQFASLTCKRTDDKYLQRPAGTAFTSWKEVQLRVYDPVNPRPDFLKFGLDIICNPRAYELAGPSLAKSGQLLPLTIEGETGTHYFYNCTTVIDALDEDRSIWVYSKNTHTTNLTMPSFHAKRLKGTTLFKFPRHGLARLYAVEHTGNYRDGEFKALVEYHKLTGLSFRLLWDVDQGPTQPHFMYEDHHPFEYRTFDGKKWVFAYVKKSAPQSKTAAAEKMEEDGTPDPRENYYRKPGPGTTVFELQSVIPTNRGKPKPAPLLSASPRNEAFLASDRFRGDPFPEEWRCVELNFGAHKPWQADLYFYGPGALVCSQKAKDWLAPLEDEGEFLPVKIKGIPGRYFLFNSTTCVNVLDPKRTVWKKSAKNKQDRTMIKPFFFAQRLGEECLFKVLEEGGCRLYCIERTADPYDGEFRALIESGGLTGIAFKKVWSGGR